MASHRRWIALALLVGIAGPLTFVVPQFLLSSAVELDPVIAIAIMDASKWVSALMPAAGILLLVGRKYAARAPTKLVVQEGSALALGFGLGVCVAIALFVGTAAAIVLQ